MFLPLLPITLNFEQEAVDQGAIGSTGPSLFGNFVGSILSGIMAIAAVLVLLQLGQGAVDWINSSGDKGKLDAARQKITNAIIGVIVLAATVAIFQVLQTFLGVDVLNFGGGSSSSGGGTSVTQCASGSVFCAGCINACRPLSQGTCNTQIDRECQLNSTCTGQGVMVAQGRPCCTGLRQYPNGRCDL